MQIGNKTFPHPIINANKSLSDYGEYEFKLEFDADDKSDPKYVSLKNIKLISDSPIINKLIEKNKIGCAILYESPNSMFRKIKYLNDKDCFIDFKRADFNGNIEITLLAYAKEDFEIDFSELGEDYNGINFRIEKYDILGVQDNLSFKINHENSEENLVKSIFSITSDENILDESLNCDYTGNKIKITMSKEVYSKYYNVYSSSAYSEIFFSLILIPVLTEALSKCKEKLIADYDFDNLISDYSWFKSIINQHERLGITFNEDEFKNESPLLIAQRVFKLPFGKSINEVYSLINNNGEDEDE